MLSRRHVLCMGAALLTAPVWAGLYDDDKNVKEGELNDRDYWQAKWDMMMLDYALKQKQPEGKIGLNLVSTVHNLEDLKKKYPKHGEVAEMLEKATKVQEKVDPNADRGGAWKPGCPWDEANFAQLWINWHAAHAAAKEKEYDKAWGYMTNVNQNIDLLSAPDRLKDYPDELKEFYDKTKPEAKKFSK
jgi:hypothetical protein